MAILRVIVFGATGEIGHVLAKACAAFGHKTAAVVRQTTLDSKADLIEQLKGDRVSIVVLDVVHSSVEDITSLLSHYDVVVSALSGGAMAEQPKLIDAAQKAGIKRFLPSEFGHDADVGYGAPLDLILGPKKAARRQLEQSGVPYTFVVSHMFAGWCLPNFGDITKSHSEVATEVDVFDGGNNKAGVIVDEKNIGQYVAATLADPRTANKTLYLAPPSNTWWSQNELLDLYEKKSEKSIKRNPVSKEALRATINDTTDPLYAAFEEMKYFLWVDQYYTREKRTLEASVLYPEVDVITVEQFISKLAKQ